MKNENFSFFKITKTLCALVFLSFSQVGYTQFIPATTPEYAYPAGGINAKTEHSSCYRFNNLVLAAWDGPSMGGQVIGQVLGSGGVPVCQGIVNYPPGIRDIEVGMLGGSNGVFVVFVAYHEDNIGHKLEQYHWDPAACTFILFSTTVLSTNPDYSRISMDSHKLYGLVIGWDDNGVLHSIMYNSASGTITNGIIHKLTSSSPSVDAMYEVDVAFSHDDNAPLKMNYVYQTVDPTATIYNLEVSSALYWTELTSGAPIMTSTLVDVNPITLSPAHRIIPNIDGPDHGWDNCAYAYTDDQSNIKVRLLNSTISTVIVNDATLIGQGTAINNVDNHFPTLSYNSSGDNIMVGWLTTWGGSPTGFYVATEMTRNGVFLSSAPDYLEISNNITATSDAPTLAFTKMNQTTSNTIYAFFSELNGGNYEAKHKYHPMATSSSFKKEKEHRCSDEAHDHLFFEVPENKIAAYPNPFRNSLSLSAMRPLEGIVALHINDLTGRTIARFTNDWGTLNSQLREYSQQLDPGVYTIQIDGHSEPIKVQKI